MHDNQPAGGTPSTEPAAAEPTPNPGRASGTRRMIASLLLAVGLLTVGGVAIVNAASPSPGASAAPTAPGGSGGSNGSGGSGTHPAGNCPNM